MNILAQQDIGDTAWDAFCATSPDAWLRHTRAFMALSLTLDPHARDYSFGVMRDGALVAIVPLMCQGSEGQREFKMGGTPVPYPALAHDVTPEERADILKVIFDEVARLAKVNEVHAATMFVDPLAASSPSLRENPLVPFGFDDTSITTTCVDLRRDEKELLAAMAKGHRSDVHFAQKAGYAISCFDSRSFTHELAQMYTKIYFAAAGKEVGAPLRWEKTFDLVRRGDAFVVFGSPANGGEYVSCAMVFAYKKSAYYAQSALLPDARFAYRGLGHLMQWEIMQRLRQNGFEQYDIGWQEKPEDSTPKEQAIARFKRLFGGTLLPMYRGVRTW